MEMRQKKPIESCNIPHAYAFHLNIMQSKGSKLVPVIHTRMTHVKALTDEIIIIEIDSYWKLKHQLN